MFLDNPCQGGVFLNVSWTFYGFERSAKSYVFSLWSSLFSPSCLVDGLDLPDQTIDRAMPLDTRGDLANAQRLDRTQGKPSQPQPLIILFR